MPAFYTVVQCVPDPIADERINVGVIVYGDGQIRSRFLRNWDRVHRFAQEDIGYVREFAERVEEAALASAAGSFQPVITGFPAPARLDEAELMTIAAEWSGSIQLTAPQGSLEPPETLLRNMADTFLKEPRGQPARFRDRQEAARLAVRLVRHAVEDRIDVTTARQVVHGGYQIAGKVIPRRKVDLAVTNGRVYVASRALSFETGDMRELDRQMSEGIDTLRDVGDLHRPVRLDMLMLPPKREMRAYREAEKRFREAVSACQTINVRVVLEADAEEWAEEIAGIAAAEIVRPMRVELG